MPYRRVSELPDSVRDNLPEHALEIFLEAYNSALEQYDKPGKRKPGVSREETASRVAWAAVKKKYEKHQATGKWQEKK